MKHVFKERSRFRFPFVSLAVLCLGLYVRAEEKPLEPMDEVYSGVYVNDRDAQIIVYAPSNSMEVVMDYTSPVEGAMVLFLRGEKTGLAPHSIQTAGSHGDRPMDILFDGGAIFARIGDPNDSEKYFKSDATGILRSGRDRRPEAAETEPSESAEAERMGLLFRDYDELWSRLRNTRVCLEPDFLEIRSSEQAAPHTRFTRRGPLSEDLMENLASKKKDREKGLAEADDLIKIEQEIEERP